MERAAVTRWVGWRGMAGLIGGGVLALGALGLAVESVTTPNDALVIAAGIALLVAQLCLLGAIVALYVRPPVGARQSRTLLILYIVIGIVAAGLPGLVPIGLIGIGSRAFTIGLGRVMVVLGILGFVLALPVGLWTALLGVAPEWLAAGLVLYGAGWIALGWMLWQFDHIRPQAE